VTALILTYHGVGSADGALAVPADLLAAHLDVVRERAAAVRTITELAAALRSDTLSDGTVAITFDDGLASAVSQAAPLLGERGLRATFFCVAGRLGGTSDWPTARARSPRLPLATVSEVAALSAGGHELGAHGYTHAPLVSDDEALLRHELVEARAILEDATGAPVPTFAYPYGAGPTAAAEVLVQETYDAACTTRAALVRAGEGVYALPRVDAHYLRRPELLERAIRGELRHYLRARRVAASARRALVKDYTLTIDGGDPSE